MALLRICQQAAVLIGITVPSTVVGNEDPEVRELLEFANVEGESLMRRAPWQALQAEVTFAAVAGEVQTGMVPPDLDRFVDDTFWNRTRRRRMIGPVSAEDWQAFKATTTTPIDNWFRVRGGDILIFPNPTANDTLAFEYISGNWCRSASNAPQSRFLADTDTTPLPERLFWLGIRWRFKRAKDLSWEADAEDYEIQVRLAIRNDQPRRTLDMAGNGMREVRPGAYVPEGDWFR